MWRQIAGAHCTVSLRSLNFCTRSLATAYLEDTIAKRCWRARYQTPTPDSLCCRNAQARSTIHAANERRSQFHREAHEGHKEAEDSDLGLVDWTYEGRIPAKGNATNLWKDAKEKEEVFEIETDSFGPLDCSWKLVMKADFSIAEPPTHVSFRVTALRSNRQPSERHFCSGLWSISDGNHTLFTYPKGEDVWSVKLQSTFGFDQALPTPQFETAIRSSTFLTCSVTLTVHTTPSGVHAPFPPIDQYPRSDRYSDVNLELNLQPFSTTIPAHRNDLAASSEFFRSKFDFDQRSGALTTTPISKCTIEGFTEAGIRAMLEFMYTQQIASHMPTPLPGKLQLIPICEFFQVTCTHEHIAPHVLQHITPDTAIKISEVGYSYRTMSNSLAKGAGKYLKSNWMELLSQPAFIDSLTVDGLGDLLKYLLKGE
ncbi:hypothetical protein HK097_008607 [Rhizophlyctis rosea]|uniref:BTB domain-containing protein n=1 Tax=Rhizophlyctis rosea TaxID=64517 RepID=A0AAD5X4G5_9FUNG|nr:hypothetical protein HK097_008607 [Rhizophlyctis rosea]